MSNLHIKCGNVEVKSDGRLCNTNITIDGKEIQVYRFAIDFDTAKGEVPRMIMEFPILPIPPKEEKDV